MSAEQQLLDTLRGTVTKQAAQIDQLADDLDDARKSLAAATKVNTDLEAALILAQHRLNWLRPHYDGLAGQAIDRDLQAIAGAMAAAR